MSEDESPRKVPRDWCVRPETFGKYADAEFHPPPPTTDPFGLAERTAAQLQHERVNRIRTRMRRVEADRRRTGEGSRFTLRDVADHVVFPYDYDTLSKCMRGVQWMSFRVEAAARNAILAVEAEMRDAALQDVSPSR